MNPTQMDTELPQWWKDGVDAMTPDARQRLLGRLNEMMKEKEEGWEFQPTVWDFVHSRPPMMKEINGELVHRYPTANEGEEVLYDGPSIRFLVRWRLDEREKYETHTISKKDWDAGVRWTLCKVWEQGRVVYSKNKMRAAKDVGDHIFFEGFMSDGTAFMGS